MNNPPAFPAPAGVSHITEQGMTLRDYFAAKAMQAYMADQDLIEMYCHLGQDVQQQISNTAYQMADAMLKAREA
jgi:hypothetical protein